MGKLKLKNSFSTFVTAKNSTVQKATLNYHDNLISHTYQDMLNMAEVSLLGQQVFVIVL